MVRMSPDLVIILTCSTKMLNGSNNHHVVSLCFAAFQRCRDFFFYSTCLWVSQQLSEISKSQRWEATTVSRACLLCYWGNFTNPLKIPLLCSCRQLDFTRHLFPLSSSSVNISPFHLFLHLSPPHQVLHLCSGCRCRVCSRLKHSAGDYCKPAEAEKPSNWFLCHIQAGPAAGQLPGFHRSLQIFWN